VLSFTMSSLHIDHVNAIIHDSLQGMHQVFQNDIYFQHVGPLPASINAIQVNTCYPASEMEIKKAASPRKVLVRETWAMYMADLYPTLESQATPSSLRWIYNILDGQSEQDRVWFRVEGEDGFLILPDYKWNVEIRELLYCTILPFRRGIRTIRDLKASHLPMLQHMREATEEMLRSRFDMNLGDVRVFVHYYPTYFHFHVHIASLQRPCSSTEAVGRAILLDDVIDGLERFGDEYCKQSFSTLKTCP
jgi:m7GpppX diphosphatase